MLVPQLPAPGIYTASPSAHESDATIRIEIKGPAAYAGPAYVEADVWLGVAGHIQPATIRIAVDGSWRCPRELLPIGTCPCCLPAWKAEGNRRLAEFRRARGLSCKSSP